MPPRRRRTATQTAEAYEFTSSEKINNPTSETALGMSPEDISDQPMPDTDEEERVRYPRLQWNRGETDRSLQNLRPALYPRQGIAGAVSEDTDEEQLAE